MKFRKGSAYHLVSECGRYTVAKSIVNSQVLYEAWRVADAKASKPGQLLIGGKSSSLECIQACRKHAEQPTKN